MNTISSTPRNYGLTPRTDAAQRQTPCANASSKPTQTPVNQSTSQSPKSGHAFGNFKNMQDIRKQSHEQLLQLFKLNQTEQGKAPVTLIDPILYNVKDDEKAAEVPEYWNSDNTSQRIVDFAMSFQAKSGKDFESYVEEARSAVQKGFKQAKGDLGSISGPSAKLFNDTYEAAMKKFDDMLAEYKKNGTIPTSAQERPSLDIAA